MTADIEKLKALALAYLNENNGHWYGTFQIADGISYESAANFIYECSPAAVLELIADNERLRARFEYIEDHATTSGGGNGFMVSFFVPVDHEDIGCGIDAAIEKEAPDSHVIPPTRGTGSQQEAERMTTSNVQFLAHWDSVCDSYGFGTEFNTAFKAAEAAWNAATRCRVEGGNTSENSGLLDDPKTTETRMGSSFEVGHLGSAPAAGTDKEPT